MFGILPFNRKEILIVALCWTHLIFYGCTIPGTELPEIRFDFVIHFDKLIHAFFFFVFFLTWSCVRTYTRSYGLLLLLLSVAYGLFIEYYQFNFVDGRGFEFADMIADGIGATIALLFRSMLVPLIYKKD